jgi:hypothetical protein
VKKVIVLSYVFKWTGLSWFAGAMLNRMHAKWVREMRVIDPEWNSQFGHLYDEKGRPRANY